jgi:glycosyltransferase involved in cell wall biosynthesis
MKRIKVFLGGFTNYTNAQNLNCRALALHLDKKKFEVLTLALYNGKLPRLSNLERVKVFNCFYPSKISIYFGFLWGIWNCDVAYLPKDDLWKFNRFLLRIFNKKSFSTIETVLEQKVFDELVRVYGSDNSFLESRAYFSKVFSITKYVAKYNYIKRSLKTEKNVLYLGVDTKELNTPCRQYLKSIIMVGNDLVRKGVFDYLELAIRFPNLHFILAGSGNGKIDVNHEICLRGITNVTYEGMITSNKLYELLETVDLNILPSRSEGFPKIILEAASAGVPSVVYPDYGADEWITHNKDGWIVDTLDEMVNLVQSLINEPAKLQEASLESVCLAKVFDWKVKVKNWEEVIEELELTR